MEFSAAIMERIGGPLTVAPVRLNALGPADVLVRMQAAGICHTDLEAAQGHVATAIPVILGHEGAGIVEAVGESVARVKPGDHVVCSVIPLCGTCFYCRRARPMLCEPVLAAHRAGTVPGVQAKLTLGKAPVARFVAVGSFAEFAVVSEAAAIVMPREIPFDRACLLGCAVLTGVGAALNIARIRMGENALVVGCGAVGLSAVQGARLCGAATIMAADTKPERLALAARLGATHCIDPSAEDVAQAVRRLTAERGADHCFETAGSEAALRTSFEATRPGGTTTILGKLEPDAPVTLRFGSLMGDKTIRRSSLGGARSDIDIPALAAAYLAGRLHLDELVTERLPLHAINEGMRHVAQGTSIRSVVTQFH